MYFPEYSNFYITATREVAKIILDTGIHVSPYGLNFRQGWNKYVDNLGIQFSSHHDRNMFWLHICTNIILLSDKSQIIFVEKVKELMLSPSEIPEFKRSIELTYLSFEELTTVINSLSSVLSTIAKKAEESKIDHPHWYKEWSRLIDSAIIARAKKELELTDEQRGELTETG